MNSYIKNNNRYVCPEHGPYTAIRQECPTCITSPKKVIKEDLEFVKKVHEAAYDFGLWPLMSINYEETTKSFTFKQIVSPNSINSVAIMSMSAEDFQKWLTEAQNFLNTKIAIK